MNDSVHLLHVDDEPDFADLAATFLEREDDRFTIETASSASEGLDRLADEQFDCVVSDYDMPGKDGVEFLKAVREIHPDLPFILYTGKGSEEIASDAISAGATDYLQKKSGAEQYELLANRINNAVLQARSQQAQRHLRELAENTDQILFIFTHNWSELQFINSAYEDIWGRSEKALQNDPTDFLNGIHPDDRDRVLEAMKYVSSGESLQLEFRVTPPEDDERWIAVQGEPIVDETGKIVRVAGVATDITERKRQEQDLERNQDLLRHVERLTNIGGWEVDVTTGEQQWTDGTYAIYDLPPDSYDPTLEDGLEFYHPDDRDVIEEAVRRCREDGEPFEVECRLITAEDRIRWVTANGKAITEDETIVALRGAIQDITERKEHERGLERHKQVTENLMEPVFTIDDAGDIQFVNARFLKITQLSRGAAIGEEYTLIESIVKNGFSPFSTAVETVTDGKSVEERVNLEMCHPESAPVERRLPAEARITPIRDAEEPNGVLVTLRDISNLRAKQRELEQQNERLDQFVSVVSHDLRNPLQVAEGRLELAREECDSPHLQDVADTHERMDGLIDDLLTFARVGSKAINCQIVELNQLLAECWESPQADDTTLSVETERTIRADRDHLRQLFENLLKNAVEHAGPDVSITVGGLKDGFYVEDDGPGIPDDARSDVFDAGYSSTKAGTGFGLSIVGQVAEGHNWDVKVTDGSAGGARFEITGIEFSE